MTKRDKQMITIGSSNGARDAPYSLQLMMQHHMLRFAKNESLF